MKLGLRITTGIVAFLAMVFISGFVNHNSASAAGSSTADSSVFVKRPLQQAKDEPKDIQGLLNAKATKETDIKKNTTISSSKTYNNDVGIFSGATLTIKGGTVTINGNLYVGGGLLISSGKLIVNGDIYVYGKFTASGTASITVNKLAKPVTSDGYTYYGGGFVATNKYDTGSLLTVKDKASIVVNYSQDGGFFIQDAAAFSMTSATSSITVNNRCYFGGSSTAGSLTAGTLTIINGNFYQSNDYDASSFCTSGSYNVVMKSTNATKRRAYFESPDGSHFTNFSNVGVTFTTDSEISILKNLTSNLNLNVNNSWLILNGDLNKKNLSVTAVATVLEYTSNTPLTIGQGKLTVNGKLLLISGLGMYFDNDKVVVNGEVDAYNNNNVMLNAGEIDINGNFHQYGSETANSFKPSTDFFLVKILGANRMVVFENPGSSYFTKFQLAPGASLNSSSNISINYSLSSDSTWAYPNLTYSGILNHHMLTEHGSLTIPAGSSLVINQGTLYVQGNLTVIGHLDMTEHEDVVYVGGDLTANGADSSSGDLTDGRLSIHGNFTQTNGQYSFQATGDHTTILCGSSLQTTTFNSTNSKFAHLAVTNPNMRTVSDLSASTLYDDVVFTGTNLDNIGTDAGILTPTFDSTVTDYKLYLPIGTDSVNLTPTLPASYGSNASLSSSVNGGTFTNDITTIPVSNVPANGKTTVTIQVNALNSVFQDAAHALQTASYTVTIYTINPDLSGLGTLPTGSYPDQPFDKSTTDYTVQLPETAASFVFAPQADNPDSTLTVSPSATVALHPGETAPYTVTVTAQDGATTKAYTVTFTRRAPLADAGITVSTGTLTPVFSPDTASYNVYVPAALPSVDITAVRNTATPDCSKVTLNGNELPGDKLTLSLTPGCAIPIAVQAWDKDNKTVSTYTVNVYSIIPVSKLTVSAGTLSPVFSMGVHSYNVNLPATTPSVTVSVTKTASLKSLTINGVTVASTPGVVTCKLSPVVGGSASAKIVATAQNGVAYAYTVTANRAPLLTGIKLSTGTLNVPFKATTLSYVVNISAKTKQVTITPVFAASGVKSFTINGKAVKSIVLKPTVGGNLTATIVITATNGMKVTYTVKVKRAK